MAVHKLHIEEFDEIDYQLIAIHTTLEDYRLAYFLNQKLPVLLYKSKEDIQIRTHNGVAYFSNYIYECPIEGVIWNLFANQGDVPSTDAGENLFADTQIHVATRVYLIPELKKVNFFVKIENATQPIDEIIKTINTIDRISTVYDVDTTKIKSKNNLIF